MARFRGARRPVRKGDESTEGRRRRYSSRSSCRRRIAGRGFSMAASPNVSAFFPATRFTVEIRGRRQSDEIEDLQRVTGGVLAVALDALGADDEGRVFTGDPGEVDPVTDVFRNHVEAAEFGGDIGLEVAVA